MQLTVRASLLGLVEKHMEDCLACRHAGHCKTADALFDAVLAIALAVPDLEPKANA